MQEKKLTDVVLKQEEPGTDGRPKLYRVAANLFFQVSGKEEALARSEASHVLRVFQPIWTTKNETAVRGRGASSRF